MRSECCSERTKIESAGLVIRLLVVHIRLTSCFLSEWAISHAIAVFMCIYKMEHSCVRRSSGVYGEIMSHVKSA